MPSKTFKDKMTIGKGADEIDLFYFGRGHTNGDAWVVFPALRLVHAGDIFSGKNLPLLDANNGGSGVAIGDTLAKAAKSLKNIDTVITGHSTTMTMADLAEYAEFNKDFMKDVQAGKKAGKTVDDVADGWKIPEKYKGYAVPTGAAADAAQGQRADRHGRDKVSAMRLRRSRRQAALVVSAGRCRHALTPRRRAPPSRWRPKAPRLRRPTHARGAIPI